MVALAEGSGQPKRENKEGADRQKERGGRYCKRERVTAIYHRPSKVM